MLLSDLSREIGNAAHRFGEMILAVGAPNGSWKRFGGIGSLRQGDEAVAFISIGEGRYWDEPLTAVEFRSYIETFIAENGDMTLAVFEGGVLHQHLDLNVDQDVGENGEDVNVAIVQSYVVKPAFRR